MTAGRTAISRKALERTVSAVAAEHLQVSPASIDVRLSDDAGLLAVAIASPLRVESLGGTSPGAGVLSRTNIARPLIRDEVTRLTGSTVSTVSVRVTRAEIIEYRRVS